MWMFEYILQYMRSPLWKGPIQDFIDQNCSQFEEEGENKMKYK